MLISAIAPMVLVLAGIAVGFSTHDALAQSLNTETAQRGAELILVATPLLAYTLSIDGARERLRIGVRVGHRLRGFTPIAENPGRARTAGRRRLPSDGRDVIRLLPVVFALLGSRFTWQERVMLGWLGPRGTTSIVFGLLAFDVLADEAETMVLLTMVTTVLGSVLIHGIGAPAAAHASNRARANRIIG